MMRSRDRGSLPIAVLLSLVVVAASALLLPVLIGQLQTTRQAAERLRTLHAAQAGLDAALGQIRQATGVGSLPCGPWEGRVGNPQTARFNVTIEYRDGANNPVTCSATSGVPGTTASAFVRSRGTDPSGVQPGRTLYATYRLRTSAGGTGGLADIGEQ